MSKICYCKKFWNKIIKLFLSIYIKYPQKFIVEASFPTRIYIYFTKYILIIINFSVLNRGTHIHSHYSLWNLISIENNTYSFCWFYTFWQKFIKKSIGKDMFITKISQNRQPLLLVAKGYLRLRKSLGI